MMATSNKRLFNGFITTSFTKALGAFILIKLIKHLQISLHRERHRQTDTHSRTHTCTHAHTHTHTFKPQQRSKVITLIFFCYGESSKTSLGLTPSLHICPLFVQHAASGHESWNGWRGKGEVDLPVLKHKIF